MMMNTWVDMAVGDLQRRSAGVAPGKAYAVKYAKGVEGDLTVPPEALAVMKGCLVATWLLSYQVSECGRANGRTVRDMASVSH